MHETKKMSLDNGLKVLWVPKDSALFNARVIVNHAAAHEEKGEEGLAHYLEHVVAGGGGKNMSTEEANDLREMLGYTNATTNMIITSYDASGVVNQSDKILQLLSDCVFSPNLDVGVIERERGRVMREMTDIVPDSGYRKSRMFDLVRLDEKDPRQRHTIGYPEVVLGANQEKLKAFHARGYSPNNSVLLVMGPHSADLEARLNEHFGALPRGDGKPYEFAPAKPIQEVMWYELSAPELAGNGGDEMSCGVEILSSAPCVNDKDYAAFYLADSLLGGAGGRLHKRISEERGLAYYFGSKYERDSKSGHLSVAGHVPINRYKEALKLAFDEMKSMAENPAEKKEFDASLSRISYVFAHSMEDPNNSLSEAFDELQGERPMEEIYQDLRKVTREDVMRVADKYFPKKLSDPHLMFLRNPRYSGEDRRITPSF